MVFIEEMVYVQWHTKVFQYITVNGQKTFKTQFNIINLHLLQIIIIIIIIMYVV